MTLLYIIIAEVYFCTECSGSGTETVRHKQKTTQIRKFNLDFIVNGCIFLYNVITAQRCMEQQYNLCAFYNIPAAMEFLWKGSVM